MRGETEVRYTGLSSGGISTRKAVIRRNILRVCRRVNIRVPSHMGPTASLARGEPIAGFQSGHGIGARRLCDRSISRSASALARSPNILIIFYRAVVYRSPLANDRSGGKKPNDTATQKKDLAMRTRTGGYRGFLYPRERERDRGRDSRGMCPIPTSRVSQSGFRRAVGGGMRRKRRNHRGDASGREKNRVDDDDDVYRRE